LQQSFRTDTVVCIPECDIQQMTEWFPLSCCKCDAFFLIFIPDVFRLGDNIFASVVCVKYINLFFKYCNYILKRNCILGQAFLRVLRFLPVNIIPPLLSKLVSSGEQT
jgi:hypothetical protein